MTTSTQLETPPRSFLAFHHGGTFSPFSHGGSGSVARVTLAEPEVPKGRGNPVEVHALVGTSAPLSRSSRLRDLAGFLKYRGPARTIDEMNEAVQDEVARNFR